MDDVVTIAERRRRRIETLKQGARAAMDELSNYASAHGGRFLVFGSVARDEIALHSDFDVIVDFPQSLEDAAYEAAESIVSSRGVKPDVLLLGYVSPQLMIRVKRDAVVLS